MDKYVPCLAGIGPTSRVKTIVSGTQTWLNLSLQIEKGLCVSGI